MALGRGWQTKLTQVHTSTAERGKHTKMGRLRSFKRRDHGGPRAEGGGGEEGGEGQNNLPKKRIVDSGRGNSPSNNSPRKKAVNLKLIVPYKGSFLNSIEGTKGKEEAADVVDEITGTLEKRVRSPL